MSEENKIVKVLKVHPENIEEVMHNLSHAAITIQKTASTVKLLMKTGQSEMALEGLELLTHNVAGLLASAISPILEIVEGEEAQKIIDGEIPEGYEVSETIIDGKKPDFPSYTFMSQIGGEC